MPMNQNLYLLGYFLILTIDIFIFYGIMSIDIKRRRILNYEETRCKEKC